RDLSDDAAVIQHVIHRQDDLAGARFFEQGANFGNPIGLDQRGADFMPLRAQEGVRHAAADQKLVGALGERGYDGELVAGLGAPKQHQERMLVGFADAGKVGELFLEQQAGGGLRKELDNGGIGG